MWGLLFSLWKHLLKSEFGSIRRKSICCETDFKVGTKDGGFLLGILQASCWGSLLSSGVCRLAFSAVFSVCSLLYIPLAGEVQGRYLRECLRFRGPGRKVHFDPQCFFVSFSCSASHPQPPQALVWKIPDIEFLRHIGYNLIRQYGAEVLNLNLRLNIEELMLTDPDFCFFGIVFFFFFLEAVTNGISVMK